MIMIDQLEISTRHRLVVSNSSDSFLKKSSISVMKKTKRKLPLETKNLDFRNNKPKDRHSINSSKISGLNFDRNTSKSFLSCLSLCTCVFFMILINQIESEAIFEAAFQGECHQSNPCQQMCFDLHDGTFECACHDKYQLDVNGYSCNKLNLTANESSLAFVLATTVHATNTLYKNFYGNQNKSSLVTIPSSSSSSPLSLVPKTQKNKILKKQIEPQLSTVSSRLTQIKRDQNNLYSCEDIECEAGGVCIESSDTSQDTRIARDVRCRCPLGRGGQFCEKLIEVKQPRFMGTSYLALPTLRNAYRSLQINIEFKPEAYNGLLLYSGQETNLEGDFISVMLTEGFVEFRFDCGMGDGVIRSKLPVILNSWNQLNIYRDGRNAWMQLNQGHQIFGHSKGLFSRITFRLETFLGGSPNISQVEKRIKINKGFIGCIRALKINDRNYDFNSDTIDGIDIDQCDSDACNHIVCLNNGNCAVDENQKNKSRCICPLGYIGEFCEIQNKYFIPSFNGSSYLQFIGLGDVIEKMFTEIRIVIKPNKPDGLFFYNGQRMDRTGDFISLNLIDSYIEFRFDLGSGAAVIRSPEKITLKEWHTVYAARTGREGILKVDDQPLATGMSLGAYTQLSLPLNMYVGGVSNLASTHQNLQAVYLFNGCVQRMEINNHRLSLVDDVLAGESIGNCQHSCNGQPCQNDGWCEPIDHHYQCNCQTNFVGQHCEKKTGSLENDELYPMFYGNSFLKFSEKSILSLMRGFKTIIHLNLRAFSSNGLILWFGDDLARFRVRDFISIGLHDGHINVHVNLGSGLHRFAFNGTRIDDGRWHVLDLVRYGKKILIRIDDNVAVQGEIKGFKNQLNVRGALYLGGIEQTESTTKHLYVKGFIGCVSNLTLNENISIDLLAQANQAINIRTCI